MKTIILHGILARKFGKSFKLAVGSTKEAMRALCVQLAGFEEFMMNTHTQGLRFVVKGFWRCSNHDCRQPSSHSLW